MLDPVYINSGDYLTTMREINHYHSIDKETEAQRWNNLTKWSSCDLNPEDMAPETTPLTTVMYRDPLLGLSLA